jgi:hypothetical protein
MSSPLLASQPQASFVWGGDHSGARGGAFAYSVPRLYLVAAVFTAVRRAVVFLYKAASVVTITAPTANVVSPTGRAVAHPVCTKPVGVVSGNPFAESVVVLAVIIVRKNATAAVDMLMVWHRWIKTRRTRSMRPLIIPSGGGGAVIVSTVLGGWGGARVLARWVWYSTAY